MDPKGSGEGPDHSTEEETASSVRGPLAKSGRLSRLRGFVDSPVPVTSVALLAVALMGVASFVLGVHDAFVAATWSSRATAGMIAVFGIVGGCSAAYLLLGGNRHAKGYLFWALPAAAAPPLILLVRQFLNYELDLRLAVWALSIVVVAVAGIRSLRAGLSPTRPQSLTGAVVISAVVAVLPLTVSLRGGAQPESLSSALSLEVVGERGNGPDAVALVKVTTTLTNKSNRPLTLIGSVYSVTATRSSFRSSSDKSPFPWTDVNRSGWANRNEVRSESQLVETGINPYPGESVFQPGQSDETSFVVPVSTSEFNTVGVETWSISGRTDRLLLEWPPAEPVLQGQFAAKDGSGTLSAEWPIRTGLWVDILTQKQRYLRLDYENGGRIERPFVAPYEQGLKYLVYADAEDTRAEPFSTYNERLGSAYGIQQVGTYTELALDTHSK